MTWDQLVSRFLDHFFPVGRTSSLRDLILRFKQGDDEPIKSIWIRFQDLIKQVPHYGIQKWLLVQIFHNNISRDNCRKLDQFAQFRFNSLTEEEGWNRIEEYVQYQDNLWGNISPPMNVSSISEAMQPTFRGRLKRILRGEDGPEWIVRNKFEDELANFMLEKKSHVKGIGNMLDQHRKGLHEQFSYRESETPESEASTFTVTTRSGVSTQDPPFPASPRPTEEEEENSNEVLAFSFYPRTEPVELLEWKAPDNRLKQSSVEPPKLELKELPEHLEYAFLQENNQLLVAISSTLSTNKKARLLEVVPKKGGMTVVTNEKDEIIPQRTVTGWRVCIEYRKLNNATRKDHFPLPFIDQMLERKPHSPALTGPSRTNEWPSDYAMPQTLFNATYRG
ncbi:RNA-directed DNA polymerase [Tanacetum coccineum]